MKFVLANALQCLNQIDLEEDKDWVSRRKAGRDCCGSPVIPVSVLPRPAGRKELQPVLLLRIIAMTQINAPAHFQWPMLETFAPGTEIAASSDGLARHDVSLPPTAGEEGGGNPCSSRPEAPAPLMAGPHTRFTCCAHCSQSMGYKCLILLLATRIYYKAHKDVWKAFARVLFRARKLESTVDNIHLVMQKSSNADTNADR